MYAETMAASAGLGPASLLPTAENLTAITVTSAAGIDIDAMTFIEAMCHLRGILTALVCGGRIPDAWMCKAMSLAGLLSGARYVCVMCSLRASLW